MNGEIKVGILISFDYEYLKYALPLVYKEANSIAIAIDKDYKTWTGSSFSIPDSIFEWIREFDKEKKISIYKDSFYEPKLTPMQCETRERNMLSAFMGAGGWHIQIDSDEYVLDFEGFIHYLKSLKMSEKMNIYAHLITLFRLTPQGIYYIDAKERFPLATNEYSAYTKARTNNAQARIYTDFKILHQSWARSEGEVSMKLMNWGHTGDFDPNKFYELWVNISPENYKSLKNFHPLGNGKKWKRLHYLPISDIFELIDYFQTKKKTKGKELKRKYKGDTLGTKILRKLHLR